MSGLRLPFHTALAASTRVSRAVSRSTDIAAFEWLCLAMMGLVAAAITMLPDFGLKIPGHAILRAVFPMACGLAVVPRHGAGTAMGLWALIGASGLHMAGLSDGGIGATTSLCLTGPLLDAVLWHVRSGGWRLYVWFMAAGLTSNLIAFGVRAIGKLSGWDVGGSGFAKWAPRAIGSYVICGLVAGAVSGIVWFAGRSRDQAESQR